MIARERHVASFPAVRAIVQSICAELHVQLPLANRAVLFTVALAFRLVALNANDRTLHGSLQRKLYLTQAEASKLDVWVMARFSYYFARLGFVPPCTASQFLSAPAAPFFDAVQSAC